MEKPNYYSVLPADVRYDKAICANAKLLFSEITALCNENGICWAKNDYFANLYGVSKETISRWIGQLIKRGYIKVKIFYKDNTGEVDKRIISITESIEQDISRAQKSQHPIDEKVNTPMQENQYITNEEEDTKTPENQEYTDEEQDTYTQKSQYPIDEKINTPIQKNQYPIDEKVKDNITRINNINIYSRVIEYLNKRASKNYKYTTKKTQSLIQARLNENFTEADFKKVIDIKVLEWKNDKTMSKYLRPETLFGTKFEGYLNQEGTQEDSTYNTDFSEYDRYI